MEVIVADTTSLRSRLFFSYVPAVPFLANTWIGGEVIDDIQATNNWRVGFWVWCVALPICALPLLGSLWWVNHKAKRAGALEYYKTPVQEHGSWEVVKALFWQLDVIGIILTICVFGFILVPLTLAGGHDPTWGEVKIIAPLVIGVLCIPVWIWWERIAPHPMVPFYVRHCPNPDDCNVTDNSPASQGSCCMGRACHRVLLDVLYVLNDDP